MGGRGDRERGGREREREGEGSIDVYTKVTQEFVRTDCDGIDISKVLHCGILAKKP